MLDISVHNRVTVSHCFGLMFHSYADISVMSVWSWCWFVWS